MLNFLESFGKKFSSLELLLRVENGLSQREVGLNTAGLKAMALYFISVI